MYRALPILALSLLVTACSADRDGYPSLARRQIERAASDSPAPVPAATPTAPDEVLAGQVARLRDQASQADLRFRDHEARTRRLVAAAARSAVASEAWSVATVALADLESARSDAMIALAELDASYAARTVAGEASGELATTRMQTIALVERQDQVLAELHGQMPQ